MNNSLENEIIFVKKGFELIKKTGWDKFSIKKIICEFLISPQFDL